MDHYFTTVALLGLRDQNLPPFKDARMRRYKSVKKMVDLIRVASELAPKFPVEALHLDPTDPEWEDDMTIPQVQHSRFLWQGCAFGVNMFLYAYNYNTFTANIRFRTMRYLFPVVSVVIFSHCYWNYKFQIAQAKLFDEYVQLRARELVEQNKYLFEHEDFKRFIWWFEDFKDTLRRVHRQANDHEPSDFKDSEMILQDFIRRYTNPDKAWPFNENRGIKI